jgi:hypothetical protein
VGRSGHSEDWPPSVAEQDAAAVLIIELDGMIDGMMTSPLLAASNQWFGVASNMADLKVALEELKEESDSGRLSGTTIAVPKPRKRVVQLAALFGAIVLGVVAFWILRPTDRSMQPSMTAVPLTSYPGWQRYPSFHARSARTKDDGLKGHRLIEL